MNQKYEYLKKIPHGDNYFAVPICGLFTELLDRQRIFNRTKTSAFFAIDGLSKKKEYNRDRCKNASDRIATSIFYLATISFRLLDDSKNNLFTNKRLDWECFIIYSQIMLDAFATLVPIFYGISDKYKTKCPICGKLNHENTVSSFNNLGEWFDCHKLSDRLTQRYKLIRKRNSSHWYKSLNNDRHDYIHRLIVPNIVLREIAQELGFSNKIRKDKIIKKVKISTIEKELKIILKNLFELLAFSNYFFVEKLKEKNIVVSENAQYKYDLYGDFKDFSKLVFNNK